MIGTGTVKIIESDGIMRTLEVDWYVLEAWYNLISIVGA